MEEKRKKLMEKKQEMGRKRLRLFKRWHIISCLHLLTNRISF